MSDISPSRILAKLSDAIPHDCRANMIIIGSLAAGYHFFADDQHLYVRTKEIDSVLRPRTEAVRSGREVAERLLADGWRHKNEGEHGRPGSSDTPDSQLPAVRLTPPTTTDWFIEFLTEPEAGDTSGRRWLRLVAQRQSDFDTGDDLKPTSIRGFGDDMQGSGVCRRIHINREGCRGGSLAPSPPARAAVRRPVWRPCGGVGSRR